MRAFAHLAYGSFQALSTSIGPELQFETPGLLINPPPRAARASHSTWLQQRQDRHIRAAKVQLADFLSGNTHGSAQLFMRPEEIRLWHVILASDMVAPDLS